MAVLTIPRWRTRQPRRVVGLARSNPLTVGLRAAFIPIAAMRAVHDAVTGRISFPSSGSFVFRANHAGGWYATGTPSAASMSMSIAGMNTSEATLFSFMAGSIATSATYMHWLLATGADPVFSLKHGDGSNARFMAMYRNAAGTYTDYGAAAETAMISGKMQSVVARFQSGLQTLMVDGVKSSSEGTESTTLRNPPLTLEVAVSGDKAWGPTLAYSRYLTDAEAVELSRNPWQTLETERSDIIYFVGPAAAATGGSFNAAWACGSNAVIQPGAMQ